MAEATTEERWLPVVGEHGYQVSDRGRVRSLNRTIATARGDRRLKGRLLRPVARGAGGHLWVGFSARQRSVHSMVLEAFVGPRPPGMWGCHFNDDPTDNRLANLRWATPTDNHADMKRNTGHYASKRTHCPLGHPLQDPNLSPAHLRNGGRTCRACIIAQGAARFMLARGERADMQQLSDAYLADLLNGWRPDPGAARTHCPRQHLLAAPNLIASNAKRGHRACLACSRASSAKQKAARRGSAFNFQAVADARYAAIMSDAATRSDEPC